MIGYFRVIKLYVGTKNKNNIINNSFTLNISNI